MSATSAEVPLNWAALAVPVFLLATAGEAWVGSKRRPEGFYFGTLLSDLGCGSVFLAGELLLKLGALALYAHFYEQFRVMTWTSTALSIVFAIFAVDLLFYLWHRCSHVVNVLWAVHGVHHQSEDYNLAVALRQPLLEPITWFLFYAPLAFLGVHPLHYLVAYALNRVYQFWIHTELVRKIGPFEWLLNTPSHHRVHHGVQPQYLDKNYGAILILWDRLFGTFEPEGERVRYGTTHPLASYNPLWANLSHFARIGSLMRSAPSFVTKAYAIVAHPAWVPVGFHETLSAGPTAKYRPASSRGRKVYVGIQFLLAGLALSAVALFEGFFTWPMLVALSLTMLLGFVALLGLLEQKSWAVPAEVGRLVACTALGILALMGSGIR